MRRKLLVALLAVVALAATAAMAVAAAQVVKKRTDASLGTILVNAKGRTLYHLQGETVHHFMCKGRACTGLWPPLTVKSKSAIAHAHVKHLGTVRRPDNHKLQVTYKREPLYTFADDHKPGDTNGEGFQAPEGVWHVAIAKKPASQQQQQQSPPPYSPPPGY